MDDEIEEIDAQDGIIHGYSSMPKPVDLNELIDCIEKNIRKY